MEKFLGAFQYLKWSEAEGNIKKQWKIIESKEKKYNRKKKISILVDCIIPNISTDLMGSLTTKDEGICFYYWNINGKTPECVNLIMLSW